MRASPARTRGPPPSCSGRAARRTPAPPPRATGGGGQSGGRGGRGDADWTSPASLAASAGPPGAAGGLDPALELAVPADQRPVNELAALREAPLYSWVSLFWGGRVADPRRKGGRECGSERALSGARGKSARGGGGGGRACTHAPCVRVPTFGSASPSPLHRDRGGTPGSCGLERERG